MAYASPFLSAKKLLILKVLTATTFMLTAFYVYTEIRLPKLGTGQHSSLLHHVLPSALSDELSRCNGDYYIAQGDLPLNGAESQVLVTSHNPGQPPPPDFDFEVPPPSGKKKGTKGIDLPDKYEPKIRGKKPSDFAKLPPAYELFAFPPSPAPLHVEIPHHPWLVAVICSAFDPGRRMLMRSAWLSKFRDSAPVNMKFVIGNPGSTWSEVIQQENRTFGDIIVLEHIQEDGFTANTLKTIELFRYLSEESPRKYSVVTKIDTDTWLNVPGFYQKKIYTLLHDQEGNRRDANSTIVGQFWWDDAFKLAVPHGSIYTVTGDLVELLPKLQWKYGIVTHEDMLVTWLLNVAEQCVEFHTLTQEEKFDFYRKDTIEGTVWAPTDKGITKVRHGLYGSNVLAIHQLKGADAYLQVASNFNSSGIKEMPPPPASYKGNEISPEEYLQAWFEMIPEEFWETNEYGETVVSGVFTLKAGQGPYFKEKT